MEELPETAERRPFDPAGRDFGDVSPNPKILSAFAISGMKEKGPLVW